MYVTLGQGIGGIRAHPRPSQLLVKSFNAHTDFSDTTLTPEGKRNKSSSRRGDCGKPHKGQLFFGAFGIAVPRTECVEVDVSESVAGMPLPHPARGGYARFISRTTHNSSRGGQAWHDQLSDKEQRRPGAFMKHPLARINAQRNTGTVTTTMRPSGAASPAVFR